jgi:sigma-B regulation protein RsbU (phosphoserine phosphatase)
MTVKTVVGSRFDDLPRDGGRRVLVVDDSRVQRRILSAQLARGGYQVTEASSAEEALSTLANLEIDLVISDWVMPGISGLEFCRRLRDMKRENYTYFILLTSKNEAAEIAWGLDHGADDFLTKPVAGDELRARIAAGQRILRMERELTEKNRLLSATLAELQGLYDSINRDLLEAQKLQQSLIKERARRFGNAGVSLVLRQSGHVGGDLVGFFPINSDRIGLFSIDVSGHGITSALMTARLAGYLSGSSPEHNLALIENASGPFGSLDPAKLAQELNRLVLNEMQTESYFTLCYADVDLTTGKVNLVQAGHPYPAIRRANGTIEFVGQGGMPIGLFEGAQYETVQARLFPGDKLLIMSDGLTEATDSSGMQMCQEGLSRLLTQDGLHGPDFLDWIVARLDEFCGGEFHDDVSAVLFEFDSPAMQPPDPLRPGRMPAP